uniref:Uncharacterized protein n=1 Tax=Anguilla anguilla TaxID=7936 RepID=A0A0E9TEW6_ANGAN
MKNLPSIAKYNNNQVYA